MATATNRPTPSRKPRITTRMTPKAHAVVEDAAAVLGVPLNSFVISAAVEKASDVLAKERLITLSPRDAEFVAERIEKPGKPTKFLINAVRQARSRITT
jgi:uncharacterized protein (DUF1778 family)